MPLSAGDTIGPYEIVIRIGAGGMGEVWKARDTKLDREVAIKVLPAAVAKDPERLARFEREAKVLASLNHPNIAQVYGLEESANGRALVMELVPGETLKRPLPLETALTCARQLAEALEAAHEKGITHRDLKPANIMMTPSGVIKVLDFGLAALTRDPDGAIAGDRSNSPTLTIGATGEGVILGTAGYMSPEQAAGKNVDRRADIWSFGAVLYEMLAGKEAFSAESVAETLAGVSKLDPDWNLLPGPTPEPIRRLLRRCLTKNRQQRLQAIGEARITIDEVLSGDGLEDTRIAARLRPRWAWVVAGTLAAAAIVAFWAPWRPAPTEAPPFTFNIDPPEGEVFVGGLSLSPDGRQIAAPVQDSSGQRYIRVFRLDSLASRRLAETEGALIASWSPDSRYLAFQTGSKLERIDVNGGPAQYLCDTPGNGPPFTAWSREGAILFSRDDGLWRVSASGNTPTRVTVVDGSRLDMFHLFPQFVSDDRHFLYWILNREPARSALFSGSLDGPPIKGGNLVFDGASSSPVYASAGRNADYLLFSRRGVLMAQQFDSGKLQLTGEAFVVAPQVGTIGDDVVAASVSTNGVLAYSSGGTRERLAQFAWFDRSGRRSVTWDLPGTMPSFPSRPTKKLLRCIGVVVASGLWT